jgi:hypothetical protein
MLEAQVGALIALNGNLATSLEACVEELDVAKARSTTDTSEVILEEIKHLRTLLSARPLAETAALLTRSNALSLEMKQWETKAPTLFGDHEARTSDLGTAIRTEDGDVNYRRNQRLARAHRHLADLLREGNRRSISLYHYARSIVEDYLHVNTVVRRTDCLEGTGVSEGQIYKLRALLHEMPKELPWTPSAQFGWFNTDNLNIYSRVKTRVMQGVRVRSAMLEAMVTERVHHDPAFLQGPAPVHSLWNDPSQYDLTTEFTPPKDEWHDWLRGFWFEFSAAAKADPMAVMNRPPPEADLQTHGRTHTESLTILCGFCGSRNGDAEKYLDMIEAKYGKEMFGLHTGDWTNFRGLWKANMTNPSCSRHIPFGCELHEEMHLVHAASLNWGDLVIIPAAMRLFRVDIRKTFEADRHNSKSSFTRAVTIAGLLYLSECPIPEAAAKDPVKLLESVKANVPLWDLVGFLFYFGVFQLGVKKAIRIGKADDLDKSWRHMTILANTCNKGNYAIYGLMMSKVLHDTHPWVRALMDKDRTYRETDLPCSGRGKGCIIEGVRESCLTFHIETRLWPCHSDSIEH